MENLCPECKEPLTKIAPGKWVCQAPTGHGAKNDIYLIPEEEA